MTMHKTGRENIEHLTYVSGGFEECWCFESCCEDAEGKCICPSCCCDSDEYWALFEKKEEGK